MSRVPGSMSLRGEVVMAAIYSIDNLGGRPSMPLDGEDGRTGPDLLIVPPSRRPEVSLKNEDPRIRGRALDGPVRERLPVQPLRDLRRVADGGPAAPAGRP